jgi:hypothetical protein
MLVKMQTQVPTGRSGAFVRGGPDSEAIHDWFDYASFMPEFGRELPFTLMTTAHSDEPPE